MQCMRIYCVTEVGATNGEMMSAPTGFATFPKVRNNGMGEMIILKAGFGGGKDLIPGPSPAGEGSLFVVV